MTPVANSSCMAAIAERQSSWSATSSPWSDSRPPTEIVRRAFSGRKSTRRCCRRFATVLRHWSQKSFSKLLPSRANVSSSSKTNQKRTASVAGKSAGRARATATPTPRAARTAISRQRKKVFGDGNVSCFNASGKTGSARNGCDC